MYLPSTFPVPSQYLPCVTQAQGSSATVVSSPRPTPGRLSTTPSLGGASAPPAAALGGADEGTAQELFSGEGEASPGAKFRQMTPDELVQRRSRRSSVDEGACPSSAPAATPTAPPKLPAGGAGEGGDELFSGEGEASPGAKFRQMTPEELQVRRERRSSAGEGAAGPSSQPPAGPASPTRSLSIAKSITKLQAAGLQVASQQGSSEQVSSVERQPSRVELLRAALEAKEQGRTHGALPHRALYY